MLMPFGQYKGWDIKEIPLNYLLWLSEEADIYGQLKWVVEAELEARFVKRDLAGAESLSKEDRERLIVLTPVDIHKWWSFYVKVFNYTFMGFNMLPPKFKIERSRRFMGYWSPEWRILCINNHYILPQARFENILIHEMCHQYVTDRRIIDTSPHGKRWRNIAAKMSYSTGNKITICDEEIYAPNIYYQPGKLVILPEKLKQTETNRRPKFTEDEVEASYSEFIEELSNM